jgi:hypothetical protein
MVGTAAERLEGRIAERDFENFYASHPLHLRAEPGGR